MNTAWQLPEGTIWMAESEHHVIPISSANKCDSMRHEHRLATARYDGHVWMTVSEWTLLTIDLATCAVERHIWGGHVEAWSLIRSAVWNQH
jgi:hypothetical protein